MKGQNTLVDQPMRYTGAFIKEPDLDVEDWGAQNPLMRKCYCCGGWMKNVRSSYGTLLHKCYPYIGTFRIVQGKNRGNFHFKPLCRACAYAYGRGVVEIDGNVYQDPEEFNEETYKAQEGQKA